MIFREALFLIYIIYSHFLELFWYIQVILSIYCHKSFVWVHSMNITYFLIDYYQSLILIFLDIRHTFETTLQTIYKNTTFFCRRKTYEVYSLATTPCVVYIVCDTMFETIGVLYFAMFCHIFLLQCFLLLFILYMSKKNGISCWETSHEHKSQSFPKVQRKAY